MDKEDARYQTLAQLHEKFAHQEYERFRVGQDRNFESDFDKSFKKMLKKID